MGANLRIAPALAFAWLLQVQFVPQSIRYPETRKVEVVDEYHGTKVPDPYRWLEDLNSPEVASWVAQQNALTDAYLNGRPEAAHFRRRIARLWNFRKTNLPVLEGGRLFYRMNTGRQQQSPLYVR